MKRVCALLLAACVLFAGLTYAGTEEPALPAEPIVSSYELLSRAIDLYGSDGDGADGEIEELLCALEKLYPDLGPRWRAIFAFWRATDSTVFDTRLPGGLPDTDALCIVVLGFQLQPDGTMREELYKRLRVALACAEQYPNAYILCTGGHTAYDNESASEAGRMAEWLIRNGIAPGRVIAEEDSLTTAQNADYTYAILTERYPSVTALAVVSSDYHVSSGAVLLEALSLLNAPSADQAPYHVLACAACPVRPGTARTFVTGGLKTFAHRY